MFGRRRKDIARGERVHLFAPSRDAAADFLAMTQSSQNYHRPWVFPATDMRRYRLYLERINNGRTLGFLVGRNDDDRLIGVVNINDIVMGGFRSG